MKELRNRDEQSHPYYPERPSGYESQGERVIYCESIKGELKTKLIYGGKMSHKNYDE